MRIMLTWQAAIAVVSVFSAQAGAATVNTGSVSTVVGDGAKLCLGIKGNSGAAGALLQSQSCNGSGFQSWKFVKDAAGYFELVNAGSGLCIDVTGGATTSGTNLQQWNCSGADYQKWNVGDQGNGRFAILSKYNRLALEVFEAGTANGARIVQSTWTGAGNQKWALPLATVSNGGATTAGPASGAILTLKGAQAGNCIGVKGASTAAGAALQSQGCSGATFQQWKAVKDAAGDYELINVGSGQCIDLPGAAATPGTALQQWNCSGGDWQKWRFSADGGGRYFIASKSSGLAIDAAGNANGATLVQAALSGAASQQWSAAASMPPTSAPGANDSPTGFGAGTTGGTGGAVVRVTTPAQLAYELCRTQSNGTCTDTAARIIEVAGTIDFRGTEGKLSQNACVVKQCNEPMASEYITDGLGACKDKTRFAVSLDAAGTKPLLIGSNKTLIGVGATATLRGKGVTARGGVSNIVIRNLHITDINAQVVWGGDAITLDNVDRVWIDHNRFSLIGRQFIVSGWGKASNVTASWNEFDGRTPYSATCDGTHYWMMLLIGAADSFTLSNNWIHHFGGRSPHAGTANASLALHMINNYFEYAPNGHGLDAGATTTSVLAEGNYYYNVSRPVQTDDDPGVVLAPLAGMSSAVSSACSAALKRPCVANAANPMPSAGAASFPADTRALTPFSGKSGTVVPTPYPATEVPKVVKDSVGPGHL